MANFHQNLKTVAVILIAALFLLALGAVISYFPLKSHFKAKLEAFSPKVEQVIIRDTIVAYLPKEIEKRVYVRDTIKVPVTDTLSITDTIYLPREQVVYADSSYRVVVSGVQPRLDSILIYNQTILKIATQTEWRKVSYGLQGGVGLLLPVNSQPTFGGYIGVGVTIRF